MSNQQPSRPWFRLASIVRPAPQSPTPTPENAPSPPRPATEPPVRPPVQPQPPQTTVAPPPPGGVSSEAPTASPPKRAPTRSSMTSSPTQKPAIQSPIKSPNTKQSTAPTPSPLTLPPPQLKTQIENEPKIPVEAEQKTVLVQKTIDKPKEWLFGAPQKDLGDTPKPSIPLNEPETKEKGHGNKFPSHTKDDTGTSVVTIAGENKGAFMELIGSVPRKNGFQGRPYHLQNMASSSRTGGDYQIYSSSGEEDDRDMMKKKKKSNYISKTKRMNAFMNSNVQGFNNSIAYNSSCTHHDPGVHLFLQRKPTTRDDGFHAKERINGQGKGGMDSGADLHGP